MFGMGAAVQDILKNNNLSVTEGRVNILGLFLDAKGALSHAEIEKKVGKTFDRVTIYRTLHTFLDKGLIHSIPTLDNSVVYALCKDECCEGHHLDNHAHFVCDKCGTTYCLEDVSIPNVKLPKGFTVKQRDLLLNGKCSNCKD